VDFVCFVTLAEVVVAAGGGGSKTTCFFCVCRVFGTVDDLSPGGVGFDRFICTTAGMEVCSRTIVGGGGAAAGGGCCWTGDEG